MKMRAAIYILLLIAQPALAQWRVSSDQTVGGFVFPESAADGSLLFTDWNSGSLSHWSEKGGVQQLATGFKGPADFTVVPGDRASMTVVVPDLVQSQLRFIQLRK